ncbi:UNVERIFIED_CONTAM: hypothetical protein HDU68_003517 [Siphonaria sp. JEL0065]|nr:hypothetical protein HDU68_003517 [Siphonaria sp. JEL0065]
MLSNEVWRKYRKHWEDQSQLGPEPKFTCVQCNKEFAETENGEGSCRFHVKRENRCCQNRDNEFGCARNFHHRKHHNLFSYGAFHTWRYNITQFYDKSTTLAQVSADDWSIPGSNGREVVSAAVGATHRASAQYSNSVYVSVECSDKSWFQVFSKDDIAAVDTSGPIVRLAGSVGDWAAFSWIVGETQQVIGCKLECASSPTGEVSSAIVHFEWPVPDHSDGPVSSKLEFGKTSPFEKPLPVDLATSANPYNFPTSPFQLGQPVPSFAPRKRDDELPSWSSPQAALQLKVKSSQSRHDGYRKTDLLEADIIIMNASQDTAMIVGSKVYARLRLPKDAPLVVPETGFGDEAGTDLILTAEWKRMESAYFSAGRNDGLPLSLAGASSSELHLSLNLPTSRYYIPGAPTPDRQNFAWIMYRSQAPLILDLEFEDIRGNKFGGMVEYTMPALYSTKPREDTIYSLPLSDANTATFQLLQVEKKVVSEVEYVNPVVTRNRNSLCVSIPNTLSGDFDTHLLRYIVLQAEQVRPSTAAGLGIYDITSLVVNESAISWFVHAVIDFSRRSIVGFRFKGISSSLTAVGYFPVPAYGDALDTSNVAGSTGLVLGFDKASETLVQEWRQEESRMTLVDVGQAQPKKQEKHPVDLRVVLKPQEGTNGGGGANATIDVEALVAALRPVVSGEIEAAIPVIVKHVEGAVDASVQNAMKGLLARIEELERERDSLRDRVPQAPPQSFEERRMVKKSGGWFSRFL